ncbi:MAG: transcriptional regulator, LuxR family, partial [Myxococcales bacterium]|nr:transcriptional regulator, LuxR family [Myxococcales bacterium]
MVRSAHFVPENPTRLAPLLGALSLATDLGAGNPTESALRTTLLATRVARGLGVTGPALTDVYYTALLRYLGCSGYAHEEAALGAGDDLAFLATYQAADVTDGRAFLGLTFGKLARGKSLPARVGAIAQVLTHPRGYTDLARAHCDQAVALGKHLDVGPAVATALGEMYERHDGRGAPHGLAGARLSLPARLLSLAQALEVHGRVGGPHAAVAVARARRGTSFDPELVDAFLAHAPEILESVVAPSVWDAFLDAEPHPHRVLEDERVDDIALAFGRFVDLKSPFTLGHSTGVARLATLAAARAGTSETHTRRLARAALLHDLGRLSVPNGIWDKPGPLNHAERERVRLHAYHSERILAQAPALASLAALVAGHHERLDGSGY